MATTAPPQSTASDTDRTEGVNFEYLRTSFAWAFDGELPDVFLDCGFTGTPTAAWLVRRGHVTLRFGRTECTATAGQWVFAPMIDGWQRFAPGTAILSVRFLARWLDHVTLFDHTAPIILTGHDHPDLEAEGAALVRAVRTHVGDVHEAFWAQPATGDAHFAIQERFQGWMAAYLRAMRRAGHRPLLMSQRDRRLVAALQLLEDHPLSRPLRESAIARAAGLSISQLNRLFANYYGTTPKRRFDLRREEFASHTLRFTDAQVKTIAYKLGFSSLPHFTRWFQRRTKMTPTQWRAFGKR